jgi:arylsulfatase A-like enzyme
VLAAGCGGEERTALDPLNLVVVTLDTYRGDHAGSFGHPRVETPEIDLFSKTAVTFSEAFTVVPTTLASHSTMFTGLHPRSHGVARNHFPLAQRNETLAERLAGLGYQTAGFVASSALNRKLGIDQGFAVFDDEVDYREPDQAQRRADRVIDPALAWLETRNPNPFFLWVHLFDPHYPYDPPPPYDRLVTPDYDGDANGSFRYIQLLWSGAIELTPERAARITELYEGEVAYMDRNLGRLLEALNAPGLAERTVVCIVADHGESFTEHGYLFNHGEYVYDATSRVPWMIRWPEGAGPAVVPGRVVDRPVSSVDLFPTLLDLLDVEIPEEAQGQSVLPLVDGSSTEERVIFAEATKPWPSVERGLPPGSWRNELKAKSVRQGRWKFVWTPWRRTEELYDLETDPRETHDLLREHPEVAEPLRERLKSWASGETAAESDEGIDDDLRERLRSLGY